MCLFPPSSLPPPAFRAQGGELPWSIAYLPTEPLLEPTRRLIPPVGGVDVSPIVWLALISLLNEVLLGPQGLLVLIGNSQSLL